MELTTKEIFERIKEGLPKGLKISEICFEGCEIVI
jgi:predicted metal-dependent RNase